jgi:hypothetical protein
VSGLEARDGRRGGFISVGYFITVLSGNRSLYQMRVARPHSLSAWPLWDKRAAVQSMEVSHD